MFEDKLVIAYTFINRVNAKEERKNYSTKRINFNKS